MAFSISLHPALEEFCLCIKLNTVHTVSTVIPHFMKYSTLENQITALPCKLSGRIHREADRGGDHVTAGEGT